MIWNRIQAQIELYFWYQQYVYQTDAPCNLNTLKTHLANAVWQHGSASGSLISAVGGGSVGDVLL